MARDKKAVSGSVEPQQEEMTVVVFKFKGGAESMQNGFDAVNHAIAALGPAHANNPRLVQRAPSQLAPPAKDSHVIDADHQGVAEETEAQEIVQETVAPSSNGKPKKSLAPTQSFLVDFNLAPASVPCWKEFSAEKNPQTEADKFLVASLWTQTHGGVDPFTGSHLFTCFRAMDWKTQFDMVQHSNRRKATTKIRTVASGS